MEEEHTSVRKTETSVRILVVDDEPSVLRFFQVVFDSMDYTVAVAQNDTLALRLAGMQVFDLAFVDCFLEDANGAEVARRLRELQPKLKIALMSGRTVNDKPAAMEQAGASLFLLKPFSAEQAQATVVRLLRGNPNQRAGSDTRVFPVGYEATPG